MIEFTPQIGAHSLLGGGDDHPTEMKHNYDGNCREPKHFPMIIPVIQNPIAKSPNPPFRIVPRSQFRRSAFSMITLSCSLWSDWVCCQSVENLVLRIKQRA